MFTPTTHAISRSQQRGLTKDAIEYILHTGKPLRRSGVIFFYLRDCDIPEGDKKYDFIARLAGTAVVVAKENNSVITVWRDRDKGLKHIKQKPRYWVNQSLPFAEFV
jgi:hypothetical protein